MLRARVWSWAILWLCENEGRIERHTAWKHCGVLDMSIFFSRYQMTIYCKQAFSTAYSHFPSREFLFPPHPRRKLPSNPRHQIATTDHRTKHPGQLPSSSFNAWHGFPDALSFEHAGPLFFSYQPFNGKDAKRLAGRNPRDCHITALRPQIWPCFYSCCYVRFVACKDRR